MELQGALFRVETIRAKIRLGSHGMEEGPAQQGSGASHELAHAQGLSHEVVGAKRKDLDHFAFIVAAGAKQDGQQHFQNAGSVELPISLERTTLLAQLTRKGQGPRSRPDARSEKGSTPFP